MKWTDVVPLNIADRQSAWERAHSVLRARQAGAKLHEIAAAIGRGPERVRQLQNKALRWPVAPVVQFWAEAESGLHASLIITNAKARVHRAKKAMEKAARELDAAQAELSRAEAAARLSSRARKNSLKHGE